MSKGEVVVKNIVIKIGEKEIALNLDEARELQEVLNDVLGKEVQVVKMLIEAYPYKWWYVNPYQPYSGDPLYPPGTIMCSTNQINGPNQIKLNNQIEG